MPAGSILAYIDSNGFEGFLCNLTEIMRKLERFYFLFILGIIHLIRTQIFRKTNSCYPLIGGGK